MGDSYPKFLAAAVQAAPIFLDREATVEKACKLIGEAAAQGARLIVFSEAWIPSFPYWPREFVASRSQYADASLQAHVALIKNAVEIPSESTRRLCQAARQADAYVMVGINERDAVSGGTLYNTQLYIDRAGQILGKHRKLVPTGTERVIWGRGDGSDLRVFATDCGRIGGLICWENFMPLPRAALMAQGQQIHVTHFPGGGPAQLDLSHANVSQIFCRYYAFEGQVFVICAMGYMTAETVPDDFPLKDAMDFSTTGRGGSVIISPTGKYLAGPVYDRETILYAEINLEEILEVKARLDTAGHYARWDVTRLLVNSEHYGPFVMPPTPDISQHDRWRIVERTHDGEATGSERELPKSLASESAKKPKL